MAVPASKVLDVARAELGTYEKPFGSNRVKYSEWYGLIGPWCAMFVSWVAAMAGAADIIPKHAWTPSGAQWFKDKGQWGKAPRVGAIVFYQFGKMIDHVGIVEQVHSDGSWTAIEGNTDVSGGRTGGQVMRKRRSWVGAAGGFGYPAYAPEPARTPAPSRTETRPAVERRNASKVKSWQRCLEFPSVQRDGDWGPNTDYRAQLMRAAARNPGRPTVARVGIQLIQRIIDTPDDGVWGPKSTAAVAPWVKEAQAILGVTADGEWGPKTEAAFLAFRAANYHP